MSNAANAAIKALHLPVSIVPIDDLVPNPWNPNKQDERTFTAEKESITEYGFIDPITVRPHPQEPGRWQIIDGEHRWRAARELGYTETLIADLGPIADDAAKKLTVVFIETRGEPDVAALGKLLAGLAESQGSDDGTMTALPYSKSEIEHLLQIGKVDWDEWADGQPKGRKKRDDAITMREWVLLATDEQHGDLTRLTGMVQRERGFDTNTEAVISVLKEAAAQL